MFDPRTYFDFGLAWHIACRVKILIVTDSSAGGFDEASGFHLGQVIKVLQNDPWFHVAFDITKAHRQNMGGADVIDNFRFDDHNLNQYDQIWLFGINRTGPDPLSDSELRRIAEFMDSGGGIFATGDHENLGQAMCAEIPRVRSMRRWYHPNPGPNGESPAPDQTGMERHDTLVDTTPATPGALFDYQSDKVPQEIRPRLYHRPLTGGILRLVAKYPHPVLCGPDGTITYLPDHMHEGHCEVPSDLTQSFTFDGYRTVEYPTHAGHRERPQVIATATSHGTSTGRFGVLAAYDGHQVNVGRVVVDATWHHWFNINLTGFLDATNPAHPSYDSSVVPKWEAIKAYYRNVAVWLARKNTQRCMRNGGLLVATRFYDIRITYRSLDLVKEPLVYYWQLGVFAKDAMGRLASQCQSLRWILDIFHWFEFKFDPWLLEPKLPDPPPWIATEEFENVVLGATIDALMTAFQDLKDPQSLLDEAPEKIEEVIQHGTREGVAAYLNYIRESCQSVDRLADQFKIK